MKVAVVRGKFLNQYEMQSFAPLLERCEITAFGSLYPFHDQYPFPVVKLPSPMDLPDIPLKMPILNRLFVDAHYLYGLENAVAGFDLVHSAETYFRYTQQSLNAKKVGKVKKVIATVLENIPFNNEGIWGRRAYKRRSREELDHIIALTKKTKAALLAEGADEKKITVVSHGIDLKRFTANSDDHDQKKKSLTVLFAGRFEPEKGIWDVYEAARIIAKTYGRAITFRFVGDGSLKPKILRSISQDGMTDICSVARSSYDDMPSVYRSADIFIAPSVSTPTYQEQYCTVLLEAQAMGLPIITTRSGGIPENVGPAGVYVDEHDPVAIADAISEYIQNPKMRKEYALKARTRAETVHDATIIANKIYSVYEQVLSSK
jgi:glycosyltransferase involved in cell wall biosynthesis